MRYLKFGRVVLALIVGVSLLSAGLFQLWPHRSQAAGPFTYKTNIDYVVSDDGTTTIRQHYSIVNNSVRTVLESITLSTPTDETKNLSVTYADGTAIPFTTQAKTTSIDGYNYSYDEVAIKFNKPNAGLGLSWSFDVSYNTSKLAESKGSARTVFVPAISQGALSDNYQVRVLVPLDFGHVHAIGQKITPQYQGIEDNRAAYGLSSSDLLKNSIALLFGDSTVYNFNFNFPLVNTTGSTKLMTVTLPPDTPAQKIYINSLTPAPISRHLDADGNLLADYRVPAGQTITVKTDIDGTVKYLDYDLARSGKMSDLPADLVRRYTGATHYWQSTTPLISQQARAVVANSGDNVATRVSAINQFVIDELSYNPAKISYNIRQGAVRALSNPTNAVCLEYSDLMIALLRANGIPARMPVGYAYSSNLKPSTAVVDSLHSWVEAYIPGVGWINVDPTWGEKFANFGLSDLDHFAFAVWGTQDSLPAPVMSGEVDSGYQYERTTLKFKSAASTEPTHGALKLQKYVLLPLVSILHYSVIAPAQVSGERYELAVSQGSQAQRKLELGAMAAGQTLSGFLPVLGRAFASPVSGQFYQNAAGQPVLAAATSKLIWWPLLAMLGFLSGIIVLGLLQYLRVRHRHRSTFSAAAQDIQDHERADQLHQPPSQ